jgi:hypothetical protein
MVAKNPILIMLALGMAGCSSTTPFSPATDLAAQASAGERVLVRDETFDFRGGRYNPLTAEQRARLTFPPPGESQFVRLNSRLFSKAEDQRPVPRVGSLEWHQLEDREVQRESALRTGSRICDC